MENPKKFDDVSAGIGISYEYFLFYLKQGREIEFVYKGEEYFISSTSDGRILWNGQIKLSGCVSESGQDIVNSTKIDGFTLAELIKQDKIKITTVFLVRVDIGLESTVYFFKLNETFPTPYSCRE